MAPAIVNAVLNTGILMLGRKVWTYGSNIRNRDYLTNKQSFEELAEELRFAMCAVDSAHTKFEVEPRNGNCNDRLLKVLKCKRPSWRIQLDPKLLDKFFNGVMGIRSQYYQCPYHGLHKNHFLIEKLLEPLIRLASCILSDVDVGFVGDSLRGSSAKLWISEKNIRGEKIVSACGTSLDEESIQNDWLDRAREFTRGECPKEHFNLFARALNGVLAPIPDQLEVKGAWLTAEHQYEYVTPDKRDRHCQLFMFGFS